MIARPEGPHRRARVISVAVLAAGALAVAGCGGDDASGEPPESIAGYVPAGSPMYYEVTADVAGPQWETVRALGARFPGYPRLLQELRDELADEGLDFEGDLRPLLGERAAVALVGIPDAGSLEGQDGDDAVDAVRDGSDLLGVVDLAEGVRPEVEDLIERTGGAADGEHAGASLFTSPDAPSDTSVIAVTDEVLLIAATRDEVVAALDVADAGGEASLAAAPAFIETLGRLPQDVFGQAYLDLGTLAAAGGEAAGDAVPDALLGDFDDGTVGAAMIAEPEGVRVKGVVSGVDVADAFTGFAPSLVDRVPADAILFAEVADLATVIRGEIDSLRQGIDPQTLEQVDAFAQTVPEFLGVTIDELAALAEGRQAMAVLPGPELPGVVLMSQVADGAAAASTLDSIRASTPSLLAAVSGFTGTGGPGLADALEWRPVALPGGVRGWALSLDDELGVVYAVQDDLVLLGSSAAALAAVLRPGDPLSGDPEFARATQGIPETVTGLSWLDMRGAVELADGLGALDDAPAEARANLAPLRGIASWETGGDEPTFEAFLSIGD